MQHHASPPRVSTRFGRVIKRVGPWVAIIVGLSTFVLSPAAAQTDDADLPDDETLILGEEVYTAACSSCHQPGGAGLAGTFPPLVDNPNIADDAYIADVIANGLSGPVTVNGETIVGVMPAQSTLDDADTTAVIAYIQSGFASPAGPVAELPAPGATSTLPGAASATMWIAFLVAIAAGGFVLAPRIIGVSDRRTMPWLDASAKAVVISVGLILTSTFLPAWILEQGTIKELSRNWQDLIAVGVWSGALGAGAFALWWAHRNRRI